MITAVALNPSIDRTVRVPSLNVGGLNRVAGSVSVAAGKGMNVALAARALGEEAVYTGFLFREGAELFERRCASAGIECDCVRCEGAVRVNIKLMDEAAGEVTELNERGTPVTETDLARVRNGVRSLAERGGYMVFTGSLPPGCPEDLYLTMMREARERGSRCVLDADAGRLRAGLAAEPYLIKPNRYELEQLIGRPLPTLEEVRAAAAELCAGGISMVAVSLGGEGALLVCAEGAFYAPALSLTIASTVGAGDSMLAGLLTALERGASAAEALRLGVACASARCATSADRELDRETIERYARMVRVEAL